MSTDVVPALMSCFKVCPVILGLTEAESDDLRTEAVALLSKVFFYFLLEICRMCQKLYYIIAMFEDGTADRTRDFREAFPTGERCYV